MPYRAERKLLRTEWHMKRRSTSPHAATTAPSAITRNAEDGSDSHVSRAASSAAGSKPACRTSAYCIQRSPGTRSPASWARLAPGSASRTANVRPKRIARRVRSMVRGITRSLDRSGEGGSMVQEIGGEHAVNTGGAGRGFIGVRRSCARQPNSPLSNTTRSSRICSPRNRNNCATASAPSRFSYS